MASPKAFLRSVDVNPSLLLSRRALCGAALSASALWACRARAPEKTLVYVSAEDAGEIVAIDPDTLKVVTRVRVGKRPRGLRVSPDGKLLYVALSGSPRGGPNVDESKLPKAERSADGIGVVDLASHTLLKTYTSGQDPESFDLSKDGSTLYISNEETAELSVLDLKSGKVVRQVAVGGEPEGVTTRPDGKVVYVSCEADRVVVAVDTQSFQVLARIPTGLRPRAVALSHDGKLGFVTDELSAELTLFDALTNVAKGSIKIEDAGKSPRPMGAVISSDGKELYVSTGRGGSLAVIDIAASRVAALVPDVGARPWGVGLSPNGKLLFTANGPSDDVSVIDLASRKVVQRIKVGGLPWGVGVASRKQD